LIVNSHKTCVSSTSRLHIILPMSSTSSDTQERRSPAISSNFDRRVLVVGGCRDVGIWPKNNRNGCDRQWMSSSICVISEDFFFECKSLSWAPFEFDSQLSQLEFRAFSGSGLRSIHLPASVSVIGERCFSDCVSLTSIIFESGSQLCQLASETFSGSGLRSIHLPASVIEIGQFCFSGCG
jgi:hypothetical protein